MYCTILVPTFNGGAYLKDCINSLLRQTHSAFAIEVLDSGSTDGSLELIRQLTDRRIRIWPTDRRLTIEHNWHRILSIPRQEYMTIVGQDDLLSNDFLAEIERLIRAHPSASLYTTHFQLIDSADRVVRPCRPMPEVEGAHEYLAQRLCGLRDSFGTGFVMRSADYDAVGGIPLYHHLLFADDALWFLLARKTYKATSPGCCFSYRQHNASVSGSMRAGDAMKALAGYLPFLRKAMNDNEAVRLVAERYLPQYLRMWADIELNLYQQKPEDEYDQAFSTLETHFRDFALPFPFERKRIPSWYKRRFDSILQACLPKKAYEVLAMINNTRKQRR